MNYVKTSHIKAAVQGNEPLVLEALGIDWRAGKPHIRCPYPSHDDGNASWRWDERKARAFCSCIEKSHSVFDVIMAMEGCDFEAAKRRVAELIGRADLIQTKGDSAAKSRPGPGGHLKQDAESLLNAKPEQRDDDIPRRYLAARLGIAEADVLMPASPVVGIKSLGSFVPGRGKAKFEPLKVCPCAVFAMTGPDGRRHAHRIFLNDAATGKAELPEGHKVKMLCAVPQGEDCSGLAVVWGAPETAPRLVLAEGIETAQACAQTFKTEVEAGEVAVVAAISTSGMKAFRPWPATREVIVAADRDPNLAGEKAARDFALKHLHLKVSIVAPGQPGEKIDWLDVFNRDGAAAVRAGLESGSVFQGDEASLRELEAQLHRDAEIAEARTKHPLPFLNRAWLDYHHAKNGEVWVCRVCKDKNSASGDELGYTPVCTPLGAVARLQLVDEDNAHGLRVAVRGMDGEPRYLDMPRAELARTGGSETRARLMAAGLRVEGDGEAVAAMILRAARPRREIKIVSRPGWHEVDGKQFLACVSGEIIGPVRDVEAISSRRMAVSWAKRITSRKGDSASARRRFSSPRSRRRLRPPGNLGLLARRTGFHRLSMPQSDPATSNMRESSARSRRMVFGPAPSACRTLM